MTGKKGKGPGEGPLIPKGLQVPLRALRNLEPYLGEIKRCQAMLAQAGLESCLREVSNFHRMFPEFHTMAPALQGYLHFQEHHSNALKGLGIDLPDIEVHYLHSAQTIMSQFEEYYREIYSPLVGISEPLRIGIRPTVEMASSLSLLAGLTTNELEELSCVFLSGCILSKNIAHDMVQDIDRALWASSLLAPPDLGEFTVDPASMIPATQVAKIPASNLDHVESLIAEAEGDEQADEELAQSVQDVLCQAKEEGVKRGGSQGGEDYARLSLQFTPGKIGAGYDRPHVEFEIRKNTFFIRSHLDIVHYTAEWKINHGEEDIRLDQKVVVVSPSEANGPSKQVLGPDLEDDMDDVDPRTDTYATWWIDEELNLIFATATHGERDGIITLPMKASGPPLYYKFFAKFLGRHSTGVGLDEMIRELYPDDVDNLHNGLISPSSILARLRAIACDLREKFQVKGLNPEIIPRLWVKSTLTVKISLQVARLSRVRRETRVSGRNEVPFKDDYHLPMD